MAGPDPMHCIGDFHRMLEQRRRERLALALELVEVEVGTTGVSALTDIFSYVPSSNYEYTRRHGQGKFLLARALRIPDIWTALTAAAC